jgi:integrase
MKSRPKGRSAGRIVRHTLADGTTKVYRYGPHRPQHRSYAANDSLAALIAEFQRSPEWRRLAETTCQNYALYLRTLDRVGHVRVQDVRKRDLLSARDSIAANRGDGAAIGFIRAASALFAWAIRREWIEHNPAQGGTEGLTRGHLRAWTTLEADTAIDLLPEHLRRVVVLALYTGQRRGDLCTLRWSAYDGHAIRLTQEKTAEPVVIPCHAALKSELDAWRQGPIVGIAEATILTDARGKPWKPNLLSHYLPAALVRIGLSNELNVHGLRKLAATNLAEAACTAHEIAAITGHKTLAMVELYTRTADQQRLAGAAIMRLSGRVYKRDKAQ